MTPGARPRPPAVGAVVRRGRRPRRARRPDPQVAPHAHRRHLGRRHRDRAARLQPRADRARLPTAWAPAPAPDPTRLMLDTARERLTRPAEHRAARRAAGRRPAQVARAACGRSRSFASARSSTRQVGRAAPLAQRAGRARPPASRPCGCRSTTLKPIRATRSAARSTTCARRRSAARSAVCSSSAASCIPELVLKVVLPGVGARRRPSACSSATGSRRCSCRSRSVSPTRGARLDAVRASTADLKEREQAVGAATLLGLSEYAAPDAPRPGRARGARAAVRQPHRHQHPRPAGAALLPRRARCSRCTRSCRCHGTSRSTSRSCRTAGTSTSG